MSYRTNQMLLTILAIYLAVLSCRFLPVGNADGKPVDTAQPEKDGFLQPLAEGLTGLFSRSSPGVNIGGIEPSGFALTGQLGGSTVSVAVGSGHVFIGQGPRVVALDVADPKSPAMIAESPVLPGLVMGLALEGDTLYAVTMYGGLHSLDVSDEKKITPVGYIAPKVPGCDSIVIQDKKAYLACNPGGLVIVDVADRKNLIVLFEQEKPAGASFSIAVIGERAYIVNTSAQALEIFNVRDPQKTTRTGALPFASLPEGGHTGGYIASVRTCGTNLCLAALQDGLIILNISDPDNPVIAGRLDTQVASGLVVDGNTVYLADDMDGIHVIDISNPVSPKEAGRLATEVGGWEFSVKEHGERGLAADGNLLYVTDPAYGLTLIDVNKSGGLQRAGEYMTPLPDVLTNIRLDQGNAYITGRNSGFRVVDVADPANPSELACDDSRKNLYTQYPTGLEVQGGHAYISDGNFPFHIYSLANPSKPVQTGALFDEAASDGAFDVVLNGDLAYLSGWGLKDAFYPGKGIWVVDIKEPASPKPVNFVDVPNEKWILALAKDHLYALDGTMDMEQGGQKEPIALRVFDLANPEKPGKGKVIPLPGAQNMMPMDMTTDGSRLFIHLLSGKVLIYELKEPANPALASELTLPGGMQDVLADGKTLILGGTSAYDISDIQKPNFAGMVGNLQAWDAAFRDDLLFVVTTYQGLYIFRFKP
jgi:hypothetical protein